MPQITEHLVRVLIHVVQVVQTLNTMHTTGASAGARARFANRGVCAVGRGARASFASGAIRELHEAIERAEQTRQS